MSQRKRYGILALGVLFGAMALVYSFVQPFIPGAVCNAIPAQATFAYQANSLDDLLETPVCEQLDKVLGAGHSMESLLSSNPWIKRVAPSEIVVANLPLCHTGQNHCWVGASWVGWRSPWLRWKLERTRTEGFSFLGKHSVWPVWKYEGAGMASGNCLTVALTDNLFLVCLSENPTDILQLLDTYDQRTPAIHQAEQGCLP
jgi:hypothetical protein